jgi:hypothetical protein
MTTACFQLMLRPLRLAYSLGMYPRCTQMLRQDLGPYPFHQILPRCIVRPVVDSLWQVSTH